MTLRSVLDIDPQFDPPETGTTLEQNADIKAQAVVKLTGGYALADDTGLFVDALDGAPGIHAARYAGEHCSFADNTAKMLKALTGVPLEKRTARFIAVLALAHPDKPTRYFQGECAGVITTEPAGTHGFGYDPIFFVPELGRTFAQADLKTKEKYSHRGRALASLAAWLAKAARAD